MVAKQESGMLTVELCLSLLLFITIMLFALNFINISITTYHTQLALNHTALEVAQYSYLYAISGLLSAEDQVHDQTSEMSTEVVDFASAISGVYNNLMGLAGGEAKVNDIREIYNQGQSAIENLQVLLKNPEKIYLSLLYLGSESIIEELKGQMLGLLVQNILPKYLKKQETDSYLLHQGVDAGLMGLSLARSKFLPDRESIELILEYHLLVDIPLWPQQELLIQQRAITRAWLWGNMDSNDEVVAEQSMWSKSNFTRGKAIINAEVKKYPYKILNVPGLHALNSEGDWEIIRIFSYDATKPTNDVEHFSELLAEHVYVLGDKVSKLNQLVVQDLNGDTKTLLNNSNSLIEQTIRIIVPEDIDNQEMRALQRLSQTYQGQVKIEIATGYGRAQTDQGDGE